jgi:hypothetical protein
VVESRAAPVEAEHASASSELLRDGQAELAGVEKVVALSSPYERKVGLSKRPNVSGEA